MAKLLSKLTENSCKLADQFTQEKDNLIDDLAREGAIVYDSGRTDNMTKSQQSNPQFTSTIMDEFPMRKSLAKENWALTQDEMLLDFKSNTQLLTDEALNIPMLV
jgi:hypothetical protein